MVLLLDEVEYRELKEMDGYKLSQDVLSKLSELGVSVLFSTQIMALAEYAKK